MSSPEARFDALFREHVDAVAAYAARRDPAASDDIVAETFLVAWRRLDSVPADARPWLIGVARKVRANHARAERRRAARQERAARLVDRGDPDPSERLAVGEAVHLALAHLPERDREVLTLVAWDDLDHDTVARVLGCSRANVALRLHRAKRRFARELARLGEPSTETLARGEVADAT
jgi:RNA polymerase sigma-70 factor (ECF subfamily)